VNINFGQRFKNRQRLKRGFGRVEKKRRALGKGRGEIEAWRNKLRSELHNSEQLSRFFSRHLNPTLSLSSPCSCCLSTLTATMLVRRPAACAAWLCPSSTMNWSSRAYMQAWRMRHKHNTSWTCSKGEG
jgi:hypothetical protein